MKFMKLILYMVAVITLLSATGCIVVPDRGGGWDHDHWDHHDHDWDHH
jgi:hypothetical protein